jgi:hypothetical protein
MNNGYAYSGRKDYSHYVWPVRAGKGSDLKAVQVSLEKAKIAENSVTQKTEQQRKERESTEEASRKTKNITVAASSGDAQLQGLSPHGSKSGMEFEKDGLRFYRDVVVDTRSGLMWSRNFNIAGKKMDWSDAMKWAEGGIFSKRLDYAGYSDWRLPTIEELKTFAERGGNNPSEWFKANGFSDVQADWYWSGTENGSYGGRPFEGVALVFDMSSSNAYSNGKNNYEYVWPVRSGQF